MKVEMIVKNTPVVITDESPFFIMLRDLFYSGDWEKLKKDFKEENFLFHIRNLEFLEKNVVILDENFYEPIIWSELVSFMSKNSITPEKFEHATVDGLYDLAVEYADKSLIGDAKNILEFAIKADKNYAPAYEFLGSLLIENGDIERAVKYLERAIEIDPWLVQGYSTLGEVYYNLGKYNLAVKYWEKEIEYAPNDLFTYFMLADAYTRMKDYQSAIEILNRLLEFDKNNIIAMYELAQLYREIGKEAEARTVEEEILDSEPIDANGIEIWAKIQMKYGRYQEIVRVVEPMLKTKYNAVDLKTLLIVPYMKLGEIEKARKLFEEVKRNDFWYAYSKKEIFDQFLTEREKELCGIL
ncbi:tetratricopeptide repeat protein [Thermosipho atlanticus]|uniref:PPR repeat-containing protein n=1 Tax=Thermosipho atlanticus DSM 15807 TaxID=1123380 RepID=A0A1M5SPQ5_9BACT|nr:tetratricopeptide repeat protein [Thermosipho atlanticus]SHH40486.1 PPR repeat-containing protein [Thermosipho atlanticus DSM 15807]